MRLLDEIQQFKGAFGSQAEELIASLLERLAQTRLRTPKDLIQLHETTLFFRAFPQSTRIATLADRLLLSFAERLRAVDLYTFDDPEVSGIAGTAVSTNFSYEFARSLVWRHGAAVSIDWENYQRPDRLGAVLAPILPDAQEVYTVEPYVDWRQWFQDSGHGLRWLIAHVDPRTYDLLEIPLRWDMGASASRSGLRIERRKPFYHRGPFVKRSEVSLKAELAAPTIRSRKLSATNARKILAQIVDASAARYRELWGFVHPEEDRVFHADLGRGVDLYYFGVAKEHRLPVRAYHCGMFFTNGVPTGYVEGLSQRGRMEIGFNLYYTFREGETAWVFARIVKLLHQEVGVISFSVDPYQLGHHNDEAIDSGAFWFYRKLGFAPSTKEVAQLVAREEKGIAADPAYRSPRQVLRRLATAPLIYRVD